MVRKIIHIDLDAFYASIEQRDERRLRGRPIAVGGRSRRGVVMTASYEARAFGVRSGMPTFKATSLCPHLIIVPPRFSAYRDASNAFRNVYSSYTETVEPASLDEAYLDVTTHKSVHRTATAIATAIRDRCLREIGITASAGISYNKFLAKLASDMNKPNGQTTIRPGRALPILARMPIGHFHGVGPVTSARLEKLGFATGADLLAITEADAAADLGRVGSWLWRLAHGFDNRVVEVARDRKSISIETTLQTNLCSIDDLEIEIKKLSERLFDRCRNSTFAGRKFTLKIKYADFLRVTRSTTLSWPVIDAIVFRDIGSKLLKSESLRGPVRLIGLGIHKKQTTENTNQLSLEL